MIYKTVYSNLSQQGFQNIKIDWIEDLTIKDIKKDNLVMRVIINDKSEFYENEKFHIDLNIIIQVHALKKIPITISSNEIEGRDFKEVSKILTNAGFMNIENIAMKDLIVGWLHKENEIESIEVDGIDIFFRK